MDFLGVTVVAELGKQRVGVFRCGDVFGGKKGGQPALPVLVLTFDFAFGLGSAAGVAQRDAVEVQCGSKLGQSLRSLGKEEAVAIDVEFQWQAMLDESGGQKIEVRRQIFGVVNFSARADAGTIIQQVQQGIMALVAWEPAMRGGIQLPKSAHLEALPATEGSRLTSRRCRMSQGVGDGPAAHCGRVHLNAQTAMNLGSGETVRSWRSGRKKFANQRFSALGPVGSVIAARMAWCPSLSVSSGGGGQVVGIEFIEPGASQVEFICRRGGGQFAPAKSRENFTDQRSAQTVWKLTIMFFISATMHP